MVSRQEEEERAEAEPGQAAYDIKDANIERGHEEQANTAMGSLQRQEERTVVIGSVLKAVADTLGHAKEAVVRKGQEAADTMTEVYDRTGEKARDYIDSAEDRAKDCKDYTTVKVKETTDEAAKKMEAAAKEKDETKEATKEKLDEYADYSAEKAKEITDYTAEAAATAMSKLGELKESAKDAARKAMDLFVGTKEEVEEKGPVDAKEKLAETEEETRRRMEELRLRDEKDRRARGEAEKGKAARDTIYGMVGLESIKESTKGKFTQPHDVVNETRAAREHTGAARRGLDKDVEAEEVVEVEGTSPGAVAINLKEADDTGVKYDKGVAYVRLIHVDRDDKK